MAKQTHRDRLILATLRLTDNHVAKTFFEDAHWERIPNAPYDKTQKEHYTMYAAQSAAITVIAREISSYEYEVQIIGW